MLSDTYYNLSLSVKKQELLADLLVKIDIVDMPQMVTLYFVSICHLDTKTWKRLKKLIFN